MACGGGGGGGGGGKGQNKIVGREKSPRSESDSCTFLSAVKARFGGRHCDETDRRGVFDGCFQAWSFVGSTRRLPCRRQASFEVVCGELGEDMFWWVEGAPPTVTPGHPRKRAVGGGSAFREEKAVFAPPSSPIVSVYVSVFLGGSYVF